MPDHFITSSPHHFISRSVVVGRVGDAPYLVDGWHRSAAAEKLGWTTLPLRLVTLPDRAAVYREAVAAAIGHSLQLTRVEKHAVVDQLLLADSAGSDREIAHLSGTSHPFVAKRRRLLERVGERASRPTRQKPLTAAERCAADLLHAAGRLARMEQHPCHELEGERLEPAKLLAAAARRRRDDGLALLRDLAAWLREAECGMRSSG